MYTLSVNELECMDNFIKKDFVATSRAAAFVRVGHQPCCPPSFPHLHMHLLDVCTFALCYVKGPQTAYFKRKYRNLSCICEDCRFSVYVPVYVSTIGRNESSPPERPTGEDLCLLPVSSGTNPHGATPAAHRHKWSPASASRTSKVQPLREVTLRTQTQLMSICRLTRFNCLLQWEVIRMHIAFIHFLLGSSS